MRRLAGTVAVRSEPKRTVRLTRAFGLGFGSLALISLVQSVLKMVSYPYWWCNATGSVTGADNCDVGAFNALAALWLVAGVGICVMTLKRWYQLVAIIASVFLVVSLTHTILIGGFYLAPAALWLGSALWQWADDYPERFPISTILSALLLWWAFVGAQSLTNPPPTLA